MTALLLPLIVGLGTFAVASILLSQPRAKWLAARIGAKAARRVLEVDTAPSDNRRLLLARIEAPLAATERGLERFGAWQGFERLLERAAIAIRPVEFLYAVLAAVGAAMLLVLLTGAGGFMSLFVGVLLLVGVRGLIGVRTARRMKAFEAQLPELLGSVAAALRAGHGFVQALQAIAQEAAEPAASELKRVLTEARLGRPLEDALSDLGDRIQSKELEFVLDAVVIQRQVGGSLAGIFDLVADAVQQQHQFRLKVRALTAMGRTSSTVLILLPIGVALLLTMMNRDYMAPLYSSSTGHLLLAAAAVLMALGTIWLRRIVRFDA